MMSRHRDPNGSSSQGPGSRRPAKPRSGGIGLSQVPEVGSNQFELVHPRCVLQRRGDYEEGMELWKSGDIPGAREALRFALEGCGDNLWIHVALGRIALESSEDPELARGHFGYAFELVERAVPQGFRGKVSRKMPGNRPFYEAAEGLASCYEKLGKNREASEVRDRANQLGGPSPQ